MDDRQQSERPAVSTVGEQHLGDQERQLQRLLGIQPRVTRRLIAAGQIRIRDVLRAAQTLGDVLAGDLDVDATWMSAQRAMHLEETLNFVDDAVEMAGLVTGG